MKNGIYKCPVCKGKGEITVTDCFIDGSGKKSDPFKMKIPCKNCRETGKLNWIEMVFGKEK